MSYETIHSIVPDYLKVEDHLANKEVHPVLAFLKENAGRAYTVNLLADKFGYMKNGNCAGLRKVLKMFLLNGHPVVANHFGFYYCLQSNQVAHYRREEIEARIAALQKVRDACIAVEQTIRERENKNTW